MKHVTQRPIAGVLRLRTHHGIVTFCSLFYVTETTKPNIYLTAIDTSTVMRVFQSSRLALYSTVTANSKHSRYDKLPHNNVLNSRFASPGYWHALKRRNPSSWTKVIESHGTVVPVINKLFFKRQTSIYVFIRSVGHCDGRYADVL